jgi:MFS family permease
MGSAITCVLFGTSTSIQQAMAVRLMQGVFAGAVGVARGAVAGITDPTNEGRAYAILGLVVSITQQGILNTIPCLDSVGDLEVLLEQS